MPGRLTIGLYNSYDPKRFHEAHRRALARAASLAVAFDCNLATFGFPFDDLAAHAGKTAENRSTKVQDKRGMGAGEAPDLSTPAAIAEYVAGTTSVAGAEEAHFVDLARRGRFHVFDFPKKGFPPQLGAVVLATEHAGEPKATTARDVARDLAEGHSQLLVFGLGPHGTPPDVRDMAARELDVTGGRRVGLETATALGAVVGAVHAHADSLTGRAGRI